MIDVITAHRVTVIILFVLIIVTASVLTAVFLSLFEKEIEELPQDLGRREPPPNSHP